MAKNVEFDILARDRASKTFDHVGKSAGGLSSKLGMLGKGAIAGVGIAAGVAAVGGIAALGSAMIQGVKDAASYQQLANKTAAVLKSTGNAANQSVLGIQRRAGYLETLSGIDEELIINEQNVLATFTKVRDSVGKGNDIFNQATTAALNMSVALGSDLQGATIQIGKALNDPLKGITALSRAGVSFTAQQKDQIKAMVKAGDTMGAQKLILAELNKEFGGAAKAAGEGFNGAWARAKDSIQDAFRAIGVKLLPTLTALGDYVAEHAGPFIERLSAAFSHVWQWVSGKLWPALQEGYRTIMPGLQQAMAILTGGVNGGSFSWKKFGDTLTTKVIPFIATVARVYLPVLAANLRVGIEAVKAMWKAFETWRNVVKGVITFILRGFATLANGWAAVLDALSHIPGFGWAKDAAAKLRTAAGAANELAAAINRIPRTVTVNTYFKTHGTPNPLSTSGGGNGVKGAATGTRNFPGGWLVVGENADGSWNRTTELVHLPRGADVYSNSESMAMRRGPRRGSTSGAGGDQNVTVQLVLDGRVIQQSLLSLKRQGGVSLGLA